MVTNTLERFADWPQELPQLPAYFADRSPQPLVAVEGSANTIRYANAAFCRLAGTTREGLIGRAFEVVVPEATGGLRAAMFARVLATGTSEEILEQPRASTGPTGRAVESSWSYLAWAILSADASETPVGLMIQVTDATAAAGFRSTSVAMNSALVESGLRQHELAIQGETLRAELRSTSKHIRSVLDSMPQMVFTASPRGSVDYVNTQWIEFTGLAFEELEGSGWNQVVHSDDQQANLRVWKESIDIGKPFECEYRLRRADGRYRWHISRAVALSGDDGRIHMWIGSTTDIDDLKQAEEALRGNEVRLSGQKEAFEAAVDGASIGTSLQILVRTAMEQVGGDTRAAFFRVDEAGTGLHAIEGAGAMPESYGRAVDGLPIGPVSRSCGLAAHLGRAVIVGDVTMDPLWKPWVHLAQEHGFRSCWSFPIHTRAGKVVGTLAMFHKEPRDAGPRELKIAAVLTQSAAIIISRDAESAERRRVQEALRKSEAQERASRLQAEAANHSKDVFLATLSHELRTPLSAILGWATVLRTNGKIQDEEVLQGLRVIERNARTQAKVIEDVLDVARITSGKFLLDTRPLDWTALVLAAMETVRPSADARKILLLASVGPDVLSNVWVLGDPQRLQQAISNLLTNALKFTALGGRVTVGVEHVTGARGDLARVTVQDTGKGIDPAFLPRVFEAFEQAGEGTTRTCGGLGLGLSIVRHIVSAHGGVVRAESPGEGLGATFTIDLPALAKPVESMLRRTASDAPTPRLDGSRVLVVDDEEDGRMLAGTVLESAGARVVLAASADEGYRLALDAFEGTGPTVVVSDIGMPVEDGYSLLRRLRASARGAALPAVAITAFAAPEDKQRALQAGFQVHLAKPFDPGALITAVAGLQKPSIA